MNTKQKKVVKLVESMVRKALNESKSITVNQVIRSSFKGLDFAFIHEHPAHSALSLSVVPRNEGDVQFLSKNKDKLIKILNSDEFQDKLIEKYSEKTGKDWEYIDDIYGTIQQLSAY